MEEEGKSLEGWIPQLGPGLTLERVIDLAFEYRGNVTVIKRDGSRVVGYLFNRNRDVPHPFVQLYDEEGNGPIRLLYSEIENIHFTGRDAARGSPRKARRRERGVTERV